MTDCPRAASKPCHDVGCAQYFACKPPETFAEPGLVLTRIEPAGLLLLGLVASDNFAAVIPLERFVVPACTYDPANDARQEETNALEATEATSILMGWERRRVEIAQEEIETEESGSLLIKEGVDRHVAVRNSSSHVQKLSNRHLQFARDRAAVEVSPYGRMM